MNEKRGSHTEIRVYFGGSEILERTAGKFGTGAHSIIPKEYVGKRVKVIIGKEIKSDKDGSEKKDFLVIDFDDSEILERTAGKFGTGAHVLIPKEFVGREVKLIIKGVKNE